MACENEICWLAKLGWAYNCTEDGGSLRNRFVDNGLVINSLLDNGLVDGLVDRLVDELIDI